MPRQSYNILLTTRLTLKSQNPSILTKISPSMFNGFWWFSQIFRRLSSIVSLLCPWLKKTPTTTAFFSRRLSLTPFSVSLVVSFHAPSPPILKIISNTDAPQLLQPSITSLAPLVASSFFFFWFDNRFQRFGFKNSIDLKVSEKCRVFF